MNAAKPRHFLSLALLLAAGALGACSDNNEDRVPFASPTPIPVGAQDADEDGTLDARDNCPNLPNANQRDSDGDGDGDVCDADDDGDGVLDTEDNCLLVPNPDQRNSDDDAAGNACDGDDDNDGVVDGNDNCPLVANPIGQGGRQADSDNDGIGDACEDDQDGDGVPDAEDNCPLDFNPSQADRDDGEDEDGRGDACEDAPPLDRDNDGTPDVSDNCPTIFNADQADTDDDGIGDVCDNCPNVANENQTDFDNDRIGDACEFADTDDDGVPDCRDANLSLRECIVAERLRDNCPRTFNPDQRNSDFAGPGDACQCDFDADGIIDPDGAFEGQQVCGGSDNCPIDPNPLQEDEDSDGIGDACDPCNGGELVDGVCRVDTDGDGIFDFEDNCPLTPNGPDEAPPPSQQDTDSDGVGNVCDICPGDFNPNQDPTDSDADGIPDECDNCPTVANADQDASVCSDRDNDGVFDNADNCPDTFNPDQEDDGPNGAGNGIGDACDPACQDSDSDGTADGGDACPQTPGQQCGDIDTDDDGVADPQDNCPNDANANQADADNDRVGDVCDNAAADPDDVDGDTIPNDVDNCRFTPAQDMTDPREQDPDADGDGFGDGCDNCPAQFNPGQEDFDQDGLGDACDQCPSDNTADCSTTGSNLCLAEDNPPAIAMALVVDHSASMGRMDTEGFVGTTRLVELQNALDDQLPRLDVRAEHQSGAVSYNNGPSGEKALDANHADDPDPASTEAFVDALVAANGTSAEQAIEDAQDLIDAGVGGLANCSNGQFLCAIIHLTDGRSNGDDPNAAATTAKNQGIEFFVIGIGQEGEGPERVDGASLRAQASNPDSTFYRNATNPASLDSAVDDFFDNLLARTAATKAIRRAKSETSTFRTRAHPSVYQLLKAQ